MSKRSKFPDKVVVNVIPCLHDIKIISTTDVISMETKSLTSSVTDYPMHWGRRYHRYKEGSYLFPNDEDEKQRLDFQHSIIQQVLDSRFFYCPLMTKTVHKVLDIGTGTGIWPIELADSNLLPNAEITGIDLSAIQPLEVPQNVIFEVQDCSEPDWERQTSSIDFIHVRFMAGALSSYESLLKTARKYLRPDTGWIECKEIHPQPVSDDNTMPAGWKFAEWDTNINHASKTIRPARPVRVAGELKQWMENAGYVDVSEHIIKIPFGPWPRDRRLKQIGKCWQDNWISGLPGFSYKLFETGLGWKREEIEVELAEVRKAALKSEVHSYMRLFVVYGRRPPREDPDRRGRG